MSETNDVNSEKMEQIENFIDYLDSDEFTIDPRVENELDNTLSEEGIIGMYSGEGSSEERIPLIEKFSPDNNEWGGKTIFEQGQPRNVSLADNLANAFPVLLPSETFIQEFIEDYEMRLTSREGIGREQLKQIYQAMFGASSGADEENLNSLEIALSAGPEDSE